MTAGSRVGGRAVFITSVLRYGCAHSTDPTAACNAAMACRKRKEKSFHEITEMQSVHLYPFGDFVVTHDVSVSPRNRQEI